MSFELSLGFWNDLIFGRRGDPGERSASYAHNAGAMVPGIRRTTRSAVISDVHLLRRPDITFQKTGDTAASYYMNKYLLTFSWTGNTFSDELAGLYKINKARSWEEFTAGTNAWVASTEFHIR